MTTYACRVRHCRGKLNTLLDAGEHPVSNNYATLGQTPSQKSLKLYHCQNCRLLQLVDTFSDQEMAMQVPDWIRYSEPETHLDEVAHMLAAIMCELKNPTIAITSYIDQTLHNRLREGSEAADVANAVAAQTCYSIERIIVGMQAGRWSYGAEKFDLVLARHILNHVRDTDAFFDFIKSTLNKNGLVLFEIPNNAYDIDAKNPLMLWEAHATYFAPTTFVRMLNAAGFSIVFSQEFKTESTPVLVAVCTMAASTTVSDNIDDVSEPSLQAYGDTFHQNRSAVIAKLKLLRSRHKNIAMLGAGHIGSLFLNLHGLNTIDIDFALDDDMRKSNLLLPGSELPIRPSNTATDMKDLFILLAVNIAIEDRVIQRWAQQNPSVTFGSIFPNSELHILKL